MSHVDQEPEVRRSPKSGESFRGRWTHGWRVWLFPLVGLASLIWLLLRVIPKPTRATYPCMRVAAPVAASFVVWLGGITGSILAFGEARRLLRRSRYAVASLAIVVGLIAGYVAISNTPDVPAVAADKPPDPVNEPVGVGKGIHPGRVVWVHDRDATDWDGSTGYWSDPANTDQGVVDDMMSKTIRWLAGRSDGADAWDALFRDFNKAHGRGDVGYQPAEKITIKFNLVTTSIDYVYSNGNQKGYMKQYVSLSRQMMAALLTQLVYVAGVPQSNITVGDTTAIVCNTDLQFLLDAGFTDVRYLSRFTLPDRVTVEYSGVEMKWSSPAAAGKPTDYVPLSNVEADYFINFAVLKTHARASVTLCAKNLYGSMIRFPVDGAYYSLHASLPENVPGMGNYRALVDLMGHKELGGKTLLYLIDGLWGGYDWASVCPPRKWPIPPFGTDWPSSLLASQDGVAIDSVAYDLWWARAEYFMEGPSPRIAGGDDSLHEAAAANAPPSGTFYDPEGDATPLDSLGVHEHWNDPIGRQYTRNLGTGFGIELITAEPSGVVGRHVFYNSSAFDGENPAANSTDDDAVAPDKMALLPGQTASFLHYTSYWRGINGIMIDIDGLSGTPTATDFVFKVGNDSSPAAWATAAAPISVTVRAGAGAGGSDRVTIIWANNAIAKQWLQVTVLATANTGLSSSDVFYFGNAIGETGNSAIDAEVTPTDEIAVRNNPHTLAQNPAAIDDNCDFNRDRKVGPADAIIVRNNGTSSPTALQLIAVP